MVFFKTIQYFVLPSAFIFVFSIFGVIFLIFRKKSWEKFFIEFALFTYILFSITPVANLLVDSLEGELRPVHRNQAEEAGKAVLLLGGDETNELRAAEVLRLWRVKGGELGVLVSGRDPLDSQDQSAKEMRDFLIDRGVREYQIEVEDRSRNTYENARNAQAFVGDEPFFLVTSGYHMPRAFIAFKEMGMEPIPAPTDFKKKECCDMFDYLPNPSNLSNSDRALHEYFALWYYNSKYFNK